MINSRRTTRFDSRSQRMSGLGDDLRADAGEIAYGNGKMRMGLVSWSRSPTDYRLSSVRHTFDAP